MLLLKKALAAAALAGASLLNFAYAEPTTHTLRGAKGSEDGTERQLLAKSKMTKSELNKARQAAGKAGKKHAHEAREKQAKQAAAKAGREAAAKARRERAAETAAKNAAKSKAAKSQKSARSKSNAKTRSKGGKAKASRGLEEAPKDAANDAEATLHKEV